VHREWCCRVFATTLAARVGVDRRRCLAQLIAVCRGDRNLPARTGHRHRAPPKAGSVKTRPTPIDPVLFHAFHPDAGLTAPIQSLPAGRHRPGRQGRGLRPARTSTHLITPRPAAETAVPGWLARRASSCLSGPAVVARFLTVASFACTSSSASISG